MKKTLMILLLACLWLPGRAVLKERDMSQTLSVLRTELSVMHREQQQRVSQFNAMSKRFDQMMVQVNIFYLK